MLTDSLYTPAQFLHSPLESEPDVLAVLMAERRPRYFMLMLSLGLGPAFPMNLNKSSRKLHFQAFDRLLPAQKQQGSMLCILAYSSPAGFSLLIVLSCAFIYCRGKKSPSLSVLKERLWTKWSQYCAPLQRLAPSGPMLSEKRHIRDSTEFDVFKLPDNHHEFLLLLITDLPPSSVSDLIAHGVSVIFMLQRECCFLLSPTWVTWRMIVPSHFRGSLALHWCWANGSERIFLPAPLPHTSLTHQLWLCAVQLGAE